MFIVLNCRREFFVFCEKPRGFYLNFEKFCIFFAKFGPKKSFLEILILGINQDVISS